MPWWDQIAFMVKMTKKKVIVLAYPERLILDLAADPLHALDQLLLTYKTGCQIDKCRFIREIASATGVIDRPENERIFIDWAELKEMADGGMAIGSHTHSHPLLSHLDREQQFEELAASKRILEQNLGIDIQALAYPVGSRDSFDDRTREILDATGYRIAFSFYGGSNIIARTARYDVRRYHVGFRDGEALFKVRASTAAVLGEQLF